MEYLKENYKKILTLISMIVLIFAAYFFLTPREGSVNSQIAASNRAETKRTVDMLNDLREIEIKTEVFSDPIFTSLREENITLPEYETGKENPFKPLPTSTREALEEEEAAQTETVDEDDESEIIEIFI